MNDTDNVRVTAALAKQGSSPNSTSSAAMLTLLTEFAREGKIAAMAEAFGRFRQVFGGNAIFVREAVPAKILNEVFAKDDILHLDTFEVWSKSPERKSWAEQLKDAITNPTAFEGLVQAMHGELIALSKKSAA